MSRSYTPLPQAPPWRVAGRLYFYFFISSGFTVCLFVDYHATAAAAAACMADSCMTQCQMLAVLAATVIHTAVHEWLATC
jgi:hypothetical protein